MCIDVRPRRVRLAKSDTSSPTLTGRWKRMPSTAIVAARPRAVSAARLPAARSIWLISHPPKMSPAGLVSAGIAMVRIDRLVLRGERRAVHQTTKPQAEAGVRVSMLRPRFRWSSISAAEPIIRP